MGYEVVNSDCVAFLKEYGGKLIDLTFLDPPFNQSKQYKSHNDNMASEDYWKWMANVCNWTYKKSSEGAAIYFMQREKNTRQVLRVLEDTGWSFQNLVIWKKKTSAVPSPIRFGKHFQIIAFATKGSKPRVFNKLRIDPPLLETEKNRRPNGIFVTDVWDDIRELTSGYFAGDEPLRDENGDRIHKQQSPIQLLARIVLSSTSVGDLVFDPFAGTGTTLVVANQLGRESLGVELDEDNYRIIRSRIENNRAEDDISKFRSQYKFTENLVAIWPTQTSDHRLWDTPTQLKLNEPVE